MEGLVQEIGRTQKGGPKYKIQGHWYYPSRDVDMSPVKVGDSISFDAAQGKSFADGKPGVYFINKWGFQPREVFQDTKNSTEIWYDPKLKSQMQPSQHVVPTQSPVDEPSLRYISNIVGSAIASGAIKEPKDILSWAHGAFDSLNNLKVKLPLEQPFDEQMDESFYKGLPPKATDAQAEEDF